MALVRVANLPQSAMTSGLFNHEACHPRPVVRGAREVRRHAQVLGI